MESLPSTLRQEWHRYTHGDHQEVTWGAEKMRSWWLYSPGTQGSPCWASLLPIGLPFRTHGSQARVNTTRSRALFAMKPGDLDNESPGKQPPVLNIAAIDNSAKFKLIKLPYKPNPPYTGPVNPTWEANKRSLMTKRPLPQELWF